jgi:hypothetical protein
MKTPANEQMNRQVESAEDFAFYLDSAKSTKDFKKVIIRCQLPIEPMPFLDGLRNFAYLALPGLFADKKLCTGISHGVLSDTYSLSYPFSSQNIEEHLVSPDYTIDMPGRKMGVVEAVKCIFNPANYLVPMWAANKYVIDAPQRSDSHFLEHLAKKLKDEDLIKDWAEKARKRKEDEFFKSFAA